MSKKYTGIDYDDFDFKMFFLKTFCEVWETSKKKITNVMTDSFVDIVDDLSEKIFIELENNKDLKNLDMHDMHRIKFDMLINMLQKNIGFLLNLLISLFTAFPQISCLNYEEVFDRNITLEEMKNKFLPDNEKSYNYIYDSILEDKEKNKENFIKICMQSLKNSYENAAKEIESKK